MEFNRVAIALVVAGILSGCSEKGTQKDDAKVQETGQAVIEPGIGLSGSGEELYEKNCVKCHGTLGDGKGVQEGVPRVTARDFTSGVYKYKTTPKGSLPTEGDLARTIAQGIPGSSMPKFPHLSEADMAVVAEHLLKLSGEKSMGKPIPIPMPMARFFMKPEKAAAQGSSLYQMLKCVDCHGASGKGDGPLADKLGKDAWGNDQKPTDLTSGVFKGGASKHDVYRSLMTGIDGTAMPGFNHVFTSPDGKKIRRHDAWRLTEYILSLHGTKK